MKSRCGDKMDGKCSMHKDKIKAYILARIREENRTPGGTWLRRQGNIKVDLKEDMRMWI
jgi:hypothetical protein